MKNLLIYSAMLLTILACNKPQSFNRESNFNNNWQFYLSKDTNAVDMNAVDWRNVNLPHDWSVEFAFDSINGEGCTGYLLGGIGWYKKQFSTPVAEDKKTFVWFDGVYNNSEYWINGQKLGVHPYGYSPFYFDITNYLNTHGESNELVVKVDHSRYADSRWYTGSGIYRNVKLITVNRLHIPIWGTFISTPKVSEEKAEVDIELNVSNAWASHQTCDLVTEIFDPKGALVSKVMDEGCFFKVGASLLKKNITIVKPQLWDVDSPHLYTAKLSLIKQGELIDEYKTSFGIRSFQFSKDKGFFLNQKNMKIKGVCLHHDAGLVGAAVPKGVWRRRLQFLKEAGCNAIRVSHNPASDEFLDLCDEMGFLVQDEFFDEWDYPKDKRLNMNERHDDYITRGYVEHFQDWAKSDLTNTILAHRNHPCVFQWSIGNEIEWTYPRNAKATGFFGNMNWDGNYFWSQPPYTPQKIRAEYNKLPAEKYNIGETAQKLSKWTKELDTTRPVIANCILPSASFESGYTDALDIVGYSYRRVMYDYAKEYYPNKVVMGTENVPQWHEWKDIENRDHISGTFLWTGFDYMGESNARWPRKATDSGLMDLIAYPKPAYHMYKCLWSDEPHIYISSNTAEDSPYKILEKGEIIEKKEGAWQNVLWFWHKSNEHWNYKRQESVIVEVISNCPEIELFINNKSLGTKKLNDFQDRIYKWELPFVNGELKAVGRNLGTTIQESIKTSSNASELHVDVDVLKLSGEKGDVAHVLIQVVDENGVPVKNQEQTIAFALEGPIKNLGVDNGDPSNVNKFQSNVIKTFKGRAMMIVQALNEKGEGNIIISSENLKNTKVKIDVQ
ncbi:glycoside hydrolase family 2 TIM barrel-domain containing protein [Labilibacter marinus]|uniref:glycoside hydrolase family 2 TIM barrel-domain containing protein n=1 Tax=Labilibacter marinus TaxID=1477105 RepID=UPI00094FB896|nr:glycoside hydrolase family 2 TIM barrel-domain containing protein [Labilibacter marinus]